MRKLLLVGLALALMVSMAPVFSASVTFAAGKEIVIGALYPVSGPLALLGEESWRGAELARLVRNKKGGIKGKKVVFANGDCPDVAAARSEAERLIESKKMKLIIGTYSSSRCMAATEVAARKNISYFELGAIANAITSRGYPTVYRTAVRAIGFSECQVDFILNFLAPALKKKPKEMRISIAHEDSDYGTSVAASLRKLAGEAGMKVVSEEPYSATASDLSPVIFRLKKANPDIVVAVSYAQDAILLGRQAAEFKLNKPLLGTGGGHSLMSFSKALGEKANGVFNTDFPPYQINPNFSVGLKEYENLYRKTFKEEPRSSHSLANVMGANAVFDIIEKAGGSLEPDKIRKAAMAMDIPMGKTANGWGVKFDKTGQDIRSKTYIAQWHNGKLLTVWPKGPAVMAPVLPK